MMTFDKELVEALSNLLNQRGKDSLRNARQSILPNPKDNSNLANALRHFSNVTLEGALPVFPALISISCQAVGGKPGDIETFGEAIVLISGAADLHDDIIDKSYIKGPKSTVLGKFGSSITLLAGDALLVQGILKLCNGSLAIDTKKKIQIEKLLIQCIEEICLAESLEIQLRDRRLDISPNEYYQVIMHRAAVPELAMKIGAILGGGSSGNIASLGRIGRTFGVVSTIIEEFNDIFDIDEFKNKLQNGCPPLPLIYALSVRKHRDALLPLLAPNSLNEKAHNEVIKTIFGCFLVRRLQKNLTVLVNSELSRMRRYAIWKKQGEIEILLRTLLWYLDDIYSF